MATAGLKVVLVVCDGDSAHRLLQERCVITPSYDTKTEKKLLAILGIKDDELNVPHALRHPCTGMLVFVMSDHPHLYKKWRNCLFSSTLHSGSAMLHKEELVVKEEDTIRLYNLSVDADKVQLDMAVEDFQLVWDSIEELYKRESARIGLRLTKLDKSCVVSVLLQRCFHGNTSADHYYLFKVPYKLCQDARWIRSQGIKHQSCRCL